MKKTILKECLRIAREKNKNRTDNFKHYSFVIQENRLIEWGMNRSRTPSQIVFGYKQNHGIHSENDAYRKAKGLLDPNKSFEVVNIRLNKKGELRLSKPCECCYSFIKTMGGKSVTFSTDVGFAKINLGD